MLHNICISAVAVTQVSEPWPTGLLFVHLSETVGRVIFFLFHIGTRLILSDQALYLTGLAKSEYLVYIFFISPQKHML